MADSGAPAAGMDLSEATLPADTIKVRAPLHCAASLRALAVDRGRDSDATRRALPPPQPSKQMRMGVGAKAAMPIKRVRERIFGAGPGPAPAPAPAADAVEMSGM